MATVIFGEAPQRLTVKLAGVLDIYAAKEACAALAPAISSTRPTLELDLSGLEELDLAGVQVLHWARSTALANGLQVEVTNPSAAVLGAATSLRIDWVRS